MKQVFDPGAASGGDTSDAFWFLLEDHGAAFLVSEGVFEPLRRAVRSALEQPCEGTSEAKRRLAENLEGQAVPSMEAMEPVFRDVRSAIHERAFAVAEDLLHRDPHAWMALDAAAEAAFRQAGCELPENLRAALAEAAKAPIEPPVRLGGTNPIVAGASIHERWMSRLATFEDEERSAASTRLTSLLAEAFYRVVHAWRHTEKAPASGTGGR